ncbi:uncharacterized protein LOC110252404 [Exaiptasia diaphana]|uniref:Uncharacterized protein n=1 Tax=Exaiptasia diaphana TaxID=2652724 RepID=A0A913Y5Z1_EXADI|nr:uncharacterized protein LOC110252404 [Exaiptasia diaphana]KXJ29017.1 hypothetical protein AC249_AIPGENE1178 [Exaiptasia diaphana]
MASTTTKSSPWLSQAKDDIAQTTEWSELVSELFEAVQQQLTENHVSYFSDLKEPEKILFLDRAGKLVKSSLRHKNLVATVSEKLDQRLNESIMDELVNPSNEKTKTDLMLDSACDSCSALLHKWPDMRTKLFTCFNRPLTPKLRKLIWKMLLSNPGLRDKYLKEQWKPSKVQENAIVQKCHAFVASELLFVNLPKQQVDLLVHVMTKCLAYKQFYSKESLDDTDYLLMIPFLKVVVEDSFHGDSCHGNVEEISADVFEMFYTFLDYRPVYMKEAGSKEFNIALKHVGEIMASLVDSQDQQFAEFLEKLLSSHGNHLATFSVSLVNLMRSYLRSMFVGYLPLDVVCYIWDQHILSLKLQKLKCIPTFAVVLLLLLNDEIKDCKTTKDVESVLFEGSKSLKTRQLQNEIDQRFLPDWRNLINEEVQGFELPLVDPVATLGKTQPWTWWFQDRPATRQRPEDRRAAREAREMERKKIEKQRRNEEIQRQREEDARRRHEQEEIQLAFDQDKRTQADKIASLERDLLLEQQKRTTIEKQMGDEIEKLRYEIARIKGNQDVPVRSRSTLSSPLQPSLPSPAVSSGDSEVQDMLRDVLRMAFVGVNQLAHGVDAQEQHLQQIAKTSMNVSKTDYKEAEITLFGRELTKQDWDDMSAEQRQINRELLLKKLQESHMVES